MKNLILFIVLIIVSACGDYKTEKAPADDKLNQEFTTPIALSELTFRNIQQRILTPKCVSCHQSYRQFGVVKLEANKMFERMLSTNPSLRMPKNAAPLSSSDLALFKQWIDQGSPEFFSAQPETKPTPNISFSTIKERVLKPGKCTACHAQYHDYGVVKNNLGRIVDTIVSGKMPYPQNIGGKAAPLSDELKDLIVQWAGIGAPEFESSTSPNLIDTELKPTWISLRNNVFGPKCIICHNSYGGKDRAKGINLESHKAFRERLIKNPKFLNFDSPNDSHLIGAIIGRLDDDEFFFDTMPYSSGLDDVGPLPKVTDDELKMIEKWIELKIPFNEEEL